MQTLQTTNSFITTPRNTQNITRFSLSNVVDENNIITKALLFISIISCVSIAVQL